MVFNRLRARIRFAVQATQALAMKIKLSCLRGCGRNGDGEHFLFHALVNLRSGGMDESRIVGVQAVSRSSVQPQLRAGHYQKRFIGRAKKKEFDISGPLSGTGINFQFEGGE